MANATQKREIGSLDGTPNKRLFWSIISDYNTTTALCELIDNAVDLWCVTKQRKPLRIEVDYDADRQLIRVLDNAGGVAHEDLSVLISPGASNNSPDAETIGIFGVGNKRAVVALAETVAIKTHRSGDRTFQIDITKDWLESTDWHIPAYEVPAIAGGTTEVSLSALRRVIEKSDLKKLMLYMSENYARFLKSGKMKLLINGVDLMPIHFEHWAFPRGFAPRRAEFSIPMDGAQLVKARVTAGLIRDRDPELDNYGVYFYCNRRLIARHLKVREVGYFVSSEAGVPHPDASLCRAIIELEGPAIWMPWNSSKTGINFAHPVFDALRPTLIPLVSHYTSLSRRLKNQWERKVFSHESGSIEKIDPNQPSIGKKVVLPPLPRVNKSYIEHLIARNKSRITAAPWTLGLVEAVAAVDIVSKQKFQTKNRVALILLDSNFEIALKEFIVHKPSMFPPVTYNDAYLKSLFSNRDRVINDVRQKVQIPQDIVDRAKHYYGVRNKFIHERATVDIAEADVENYREAITQLLGILFDLKL